MPRKVCAIPQCDRDHYAKGYGDYHYRWQHKGYKGEELASLPPRAKTTHRRCTDRGCSYSHYAKGYCMQHYR